MDNIIVKTRENRVLYFYNDKGLCVKNLINTNTNPKMIFEDARGDFDVVEISGGEVGIICQDKEGCIVFLRESGREYLKSTLLLNKNKSVYDKHFTLLNHGKWLSVIYIVDYEDKKILSHQIVDKENQMPYAIDEITNTEYFAFTDKGNNILLFYSKGFESGYRVYKWGSKEWSDYIKISDGNIMASADDFEENVYLLINNNGRQFYLNAKYNNLEFSKINEKTTGDNCEAAVMFFEDNDLWVIKENKDKLYGTKLNNKFETVSGPMFFGNDVYKKRYSIKTDEKIYRIRRCYGYETNNIPKLIVYKNLYDTSVVIKEKNIKEEGEEICEFAGIPIRKESPEEIEINKLKLKVSDLARRISRLENTINNN